MVLEEIGENMFTGPTFVDDSWYQPVSTL